MSETFDTSRWQGWRGRVTYSLGFVCYWLYLALPWPLAKRANFLLPRAGDYAYWDETIALIGSKD